MSKCYCFPFNKSDFSISERDAKTIGSEHIPQNKLLWVYDVPESIDCKGHVYVLIGNVLQIFNETKIKQDLKEFTRGSENKGGREGSISDLYYSIFRQ